MEDKLLSVQILRGLAATMVVVLHIFAAFDAYYGTSTLIEYPSLAAFLESGVDIFFVISGFIMFIVTRHKFSRGYTKEFIKKRIFRVLPLYWSLTLFYALLLILVPTAFNSASFDWLKLIKSLLFIPHLNNDGDTMPVLSVGWTLNFEIYFYLIFAIALIFKKYIGILFILSVFLLGSLIGDMYQLPAMLKVITSTLLFEFLFGVFIAAAYIYCKKKGGQFIFSKKLDLLLGLTFTVVIASYWTLLYPEFNNDRYSRSILWGGVSAITVVLFLLLDFWIKNISPAIFIGNISYSLYLIQVFTLPVTIKLAIMSEYSSSFFLVILGVTQLLISFAVAFFCYKFIELPTNKYLNRLFPSD